MQRTSDAANRRKRGPGRIVGTNPPHLGLSRRAIGLAATILVAVSLPLFPTTATAPAWIAVIASGLLFLAEPHPIVQRVFDTAGGVVAAILVVLLVRGTGGTTTAFDDLYLLILVYAAITRSWPLRSTTRLKVKSTGQRVQPSLRRASSRETRISESRSIPTS